MAQSTTPFVPSQHGFRFTNRFAKQPDWVISVAGAKVNIGNASNGLCGGMVYAARDFFTAKLPVPADTAPPSAGSPLFDYIAARLYESFTLPLGPLKYLDYMASPDEDRGAWIFTQHGLARKTIDEEVPTILAELDRKRPVCLGLVQTRSTNPNDLGKNHQVLAYGYELDHGELTLHVYDPNTRQGVDDVRISLSLTDPTHKTAMHSNVRVGGTLRGFFRHYYQPADPRHPRVLPWPIQGSSGPAAAELPGEVSGDGDLISITVTQHALPAGSTRLQLRTEGKIRQWKGLRLGGAHLSTEGSRRTDSLTVHTADLSDTRLVLSKAKFLGIHTDVHFLDIGNRSAVDGCSVDIVWRKDA